MVPSAQIYHYIIAFSYTLVHGVICCSVGLSFLVCISLNLLLSEQASCDADNKALANADFEKHNNTGLV